MIILLCFPYATGVCGPLKQVLNSILTVDSYFFNSEATYQCKEGLIFKFSGFQTDVLTFCCLHHHYSDHLLEWVSDHENVPDCERKSFKGPVNVLLYVISRCYVVAMEICSILH